MNRSETKVVLLGAIIGGAAGYFGGYLGILCLLAGMAWEFALGAME